MVINAMFIGHGIYVVLELHEEGYIVKYPDIAHAQVTQHFDDIRSARARFNALRQGFEDAFLYELED